MDVHDFVLCALSFVGTKPLADHQAKASSQIQLKTRTLEIDSETEQAYCFTAVALKLGGC